MKVASNTLVCEYLNRCFTHNAQKKNLKNCKLISRSLVVLFGEHLVVNWSKSWKTRACIYREREEGGG